MNQKKKIFVLGIFITLTCLLFNAAWAKEDMPGNFYKGKVLKLVVGYGPGGGYDTYARLLAPWIERETGATVVVENHPGGGGIVALNKVYREKPDGLTIMLVNGQGAALAQLLKMDGVRFDLLKVSWLARVAAEPLIMLLSKKSTFRSIEDIRKSDVPVKWGAGGKADANADTAAFVSHALGLNSKIIIGYKGSKEASLAAMRGESDGMFVTAATAKKYTKGDKLVPIAVLGREPTSFFPDLPTLFEAGHPSSESAWWLDFRAQVARIGRTLITVPGTQKAQVEYLSAVFEKILMDPQFIAEAKKKGRNISYLPPKKLYNLIVETVGTLQGEQLENVRYVVLEKYYK